MYSESFHLQRIVRANNSDIRCFIENELNYHLNKISIQQILKDAQTEYEREEYVLISELIPLELKEVVLNEILLCFESNGVRRDIVIKETGNSPRNMTNLRYSDIQQSCPSVSSIYYSPSLRKALNHLTSDRVVNCPWPDERFIATRLHNPGDTHGWHWDDYSYTLIWILKAPLYGKGGRVQMVTNTSWNKQDPNLEELLSNNSIQNRHHRTFDLYLFRADKTLHRVEPIEQGVERVILNMVWASESESKDKKTHETMQELFA
jgi:hypothetical protein